MPRFDADFTTVDAGFPVHETGRYRLKITKLTPFIRDSKPDDAGNVKTTYGVRYGLNIVGQLDENEDEETWMTEKEGKPVSQYTVWLHSEGGWQFAKPFLLAATGFNVRKDEGEGNELLFQAHEWHIDGEEGDQPENIEYGNGFDLLVDRLVDVNIVKGEETYQGETRDTQDLKGWTPVGERAV